MGVTPFVKHVYSARGWSVDEAPSKWLPFREARERPLRFPRGARLGRTADAITRRASPSLTEFPRLRVLS